MTRLRFGLLLGLLAVLMGGGAFALGVVVLDDDGPDTPPGSAANGAAPDDATIDAGTEGTEGEAPAEETAGDGGPTWIAVVSSEGDEAEAQARAAGAEVAGLPTGVLRSDDHESLTPGLWVAYAGPFATPAEAEAAVATLTDAGIGGTYARCVGTTAQCT